MKLLPIIFFVITVLLVNNSIGQSIVNGSVNSAGIIMKQSNGTLSSTVGELVVLPQSDGNGNSLGSGVINSSVITETPLYVSTPVENVLNVYPNPTSNRISVDIFSEQSDYIFIEIRELKGKLIFEEKYIGKYRNIIINTESFFRGIYILSIKNGKNDLLRTYKLVKQ